MSDHDFFLLTGVAAKKAGLRADAWSARWSPVSDHLELDVMLDGDFRHVRASIEASALLGSEEEMVALMAARLRTAAAS